MTDYELRKLAHYIVIEMGDQLGDMILKSQKRDARRLVSVKTAADMLGISPSQLYRIKDNLTYVKGAGRTASLKFDATTLIERYSQYILTKNTYNANKETRCRADGVIHPKADGRCT